jgi:hypothetical protein
MTIDRPQTPAEGTSRAAPHQDEEAASAGACEILLVADRARGGTHRFFDGWRFEVVMRSGHPAPGTTLFTAPLTPEDLAASGRRSELSWVEDLPNGERAVFSEKATAVPGTPDPVAAALRRAQGWLAAGEWRQDPMHASRYHKPQRRAGSDIGADRRPGDDKGDRQ